LLMHFGLIVALFGYCFPIYGVRLGGFKLTGSRAGLALLIPLALLAGVRIRKKRLFYIIFLFVLLGVLRTVSLGQIADKTYGLQQLIWFWENLVFSVIGSTLCLRSQDTEKLFTKAFFCIAFVSVAFIAVQFILLFFGVIWSLPLARSAFGMSEADLAALKMWAYPIGGGGRILGSFFEPNMSGSMCAFFVAAFFPFIFQWGAPHLFNPLAVRIAVWTAFVGVIGTGSRQSVLAILVSIIVTIALLRKRDARRALYMAVYVVPVILAVLLFATFLLKPELGTPHGEDLQNVVTRWVEGREEGDITGKRLESTQYYLSQLSEGSASDILTGHGEGATLQIGAHSHNGYLTVLYENGIFALLVLIILSACLVVFPLKYIESNSEQLMAQALSATCVALTWVTLVFVNWAQLNQSISFMYLTWILILVGKTLRRRERKGI